jgi:hypothetical protein
MADQRPPLNAPDAQALPAHQDLLTLVALSLLAYMAADMVHEGLGHGGACLLVGAPVRLLTSASCVGDLRALSPTRVRLFAAGGCIANLLAAAAFLAAFARARAASDATRCFLWLSTVMNLFIPGGYLMVSPFANFGDFAMFLNGIQSRLAWQVGLTALGAVVTAGGGAVLLVGLDRLCGPDEGVRNRLRHKLTLVPYVSAVAVACGAVLLNPAGRELLVISAGAATVGGLSGLLWMPLMLGKPGPRTGARALTIDRRWPWLAATGVALAVFVFILGPGIHFSS